MVNLSGPQLPVLAKRENKAPSRRGTVRLKPTMDEEGLHIEDTQQRTPLLPQPRASDRRLGHVPTSLALEIGAESCEFLFLRWEMSGQLSISIPGKFRENKGLGKSHSSLTQGPGLPRRTSGLSSEPFNRRLLQSILHMPGAGRSPLPKVTRSQLGQLTLHPACPILSLCSVPAGLGLAMPEA